MTEQPQPTPQPDPFAAELSAEVVAVLTAGTPESRAELLDRAARENPVTMMLSLAYLAGRRMAIIARAIEGQVVMYASRADGQPIGVDDPGELAALLVGAVANDDPDASFALAVQVENLGFEATRDTLGILTGLADQSLAHEFAVNEAVRRRRKAMEN